MIENSILDDMNFVSAGSTRLSLTDNLGGRVTLGANTDFQINSGQRFYLDGGGDTYILEDGANTISFFVGGTSFTLTPAMMALGNKDLRMETARKFYLDGGVDTFISQLTNNVISLTAGNTEVARITPTSVEITNGNSLVMGNGNIFMAAGRLVDGVDVSTLQNQVAEHEERIIDLETSNEGDRTAFAYGHFSGSLGICTGFNINSNCTFTTPAASSNYFVVITPTTPLICGAFVGECHIGTKTSSQFNIDCSCPSGGSMVPNLDFVVYQP